MSNVTMADLVRAIKYARDRLHEPARVVIGDPEGPPGERPTPMFLLGVQTWATNAHDDVILVSVDRDGTEHLSAVLPEGHCPDSDCLCPAEACPFCRCGKAATL